MSDINNTKELPVKICTKCKGSKTLNLYHKRQASKDGHSVICKSCILTHVNNYNQKVDIKLRKKAYDKVYVNSPLFDRSRYNEQNRKYARERQRTLYKTNPHFKIKHIMRIRIHQAIKHNTTDNNSAVEQLIGCTVQELKLHLESMFLDGMTWANYTINGWHVDHIKPCASYDLTDIEQLSLCFHYTNLQPLWAKDNRSKSSIFEGKRHRYKK